MKKNFKMIFAAAAAFAMVLSCSKEENPSQGTQGSGSDDSLTPITISATLTDNMTKVSFTPSYDGGKPQSLSLAWEAEDKLRVYNHDDRTQFADFEIAEESIGQKTGSFTGEIFTAASYDVEVISGEVGYAEQTQPADGQTASLKYLASATGVTDLKAVVFTESSSVLAITALMPEGAAAGVSSVELTASEAIFSTGKTLTINLAQKGDAGDDGILHLFATLPVGNQQIAEGTTLLVRFNAPDTDHTVYTRYVELGAQAFEAGKLNTINVNASQSDCHAGLTSCDGSTAEKAYLIGDKYQLNAMSGLVSADVTSHISMIADVDFGGSAWTSASGKVSFEGNNHKISNVVAAGGLFASLSGSVQNVAFDNVKITKTSSDNAGLLADVTDNNTTIRKITVTGSSVQCVSKNDVGGLVGKLYGTVEDSVIDCEVSGRARTGGLVGTMVSGSLKSIISSGDVTSKYQTAGGLVGQMEGGSVSACSASGDVTHDYSASYSLVGGLVGKMTGGTITLSHASGDVTVKQKGSHVGGLVGEVAASVTLTDNYYEGTITGPASTNNVGGLVGNLSGNNYTVKIERCHSAGTLTIQADNVGGLLGQVQNASTTLSDCYSTAKVESNSSAGGLVGRSTSSLTIKESNSTGKVTTTTGNYSGGLVGFDGGTLNISKSYSTAVVESSSGSCAGGLIGQIKAGKIEECYATGNVEGVMEIGGLIGRTDGGNAEITKCYATGSVTGTNTNGSDDARVGGLIGRINNNTITVSQCYATGTAKSTAAQSVGGLIGYIYTYGTLRIDNSYADGTVQLGALYGGFIGRSLGTIKAVNNYSKCTLNGGNDHSTCVFAGSINATNTTSSGFIGWNVSNKNNWSHNLNACPEGNYMGTEGTISAKAKEFGWDKTIWDLSGDDPKLKWTLAGNN